jgi:CDP-diacylglycerol--glycerol-3-phosphate 3-phosphatidyltransferase
MSAPMFVRCNPADGWKHWGWAVFLKATELNSCKFTKSVPVCLRMTTANKITILRILLIPFFVVEVLYYVETGNEIHRLMALVCFAVASILDGVDGYVARHYNQISELGTVLDPLADKLLLVSAIVVLSFNHEPWLATMPLWLTGTIIGRDLLLGIGAITVRLTVGTLKVRPRLTGKIATVLQMAVVLWILLKWSACNDEWSKMINLGTALFTGASGLLYIWDGMRQLGSHPSSSPTIGQTNPDQPA